MHCLGPLEVVDFHGGIDTFYHVSEYLCGRPVATPRNRQNFFRNALMQVNMESRAGRAIL